MRETSQRLEEKMRSGKERIERAEEDARVYAV
jgi:hypothetical protein